jgi:hypothetical protein
LVARNDLRWRIQVPDKSEKTNTRATGNAAVSWRKEPSQTTQSKVII